MSVPTQQLATYSLTLSPSLFLTNLFVYYLHTCLTLPVVLEVLTQHNTYNLFLLVFLFHCSPTYSHPSYRLHLCITTQVTSIIPKL
ncbi:hypothetical protein F4782DRAFT_334041 [Xylaria castorea]|nr:hypothetical protein F4782DRAFT_334041 [Xylaria castorea]